MAAWPYTFAGHELELAQTCSIGFPFGLRTRTNETPPHWHSAAQRVGTAGAVAAYALVESIYPPTQRAATHLRLRPKNSKRVRRRHSGQT